MFDLIVIIELYTHVQDWPDFKLLINDFKYLVKTKNNNFGLMYISTLQKSILKDQSLSRIAFW